MIKPRCLLAPGLALALTIGVGTASADVTYDLNETNLSGYTGPFATVAVHLVNPTEATITYDALSNYLFASGGGNGTAAAGANGSFTLASVTGTPYKTGADPLSDDGSGKVGAGYGDFVVRVDAGHSGPNNAYREIVLTVDATKGTTWSSPASVLTTSGISGAEQILAAHIGVLDSAGTSFVKTGDIAGATPVTTTPEPSSLLLAAVGGLGFLGHRLRRGRRR